MQRSLDHHSILMIAVQALEKLTAERIKRLEAENASFKARLDELEKTGYGNNVLSDNNGGNSNLEVF